MTATTDPPDKANLVIMAGFIIFFFSLWTPNLIYRILLNQGKRTGDLYAYLHGFFEVAIGGGWGFFYLKPPTILIMLTIMLTGISLVLFGLKKRKPQPKPTKKKGKR